MKIILFAQNHHHPTNIISLLSSIVNVQLDIKNKLDVHKLQYQAVQDRVAQNALYALLDLAYQIISANLKTNLFKALKIAGILLPSAK